MNPGDIIDLDISGVAHGGVFVARHGAATDSPGRVVFVPDVIPGERVRVRLTDTGRQSFWRAEALEVLDASPHRRPHVWRAADIDVAPHDRPGGAEFGHIALEHQRDLKDQVLRDALARIGGLDLPTSMRAPLVPAGGLPEESDGTAWRTRLSLHVDGEGRVGPYAARSHRVIAVDDLPLATPGIEWVGLGLSTGAPGRIDLVQPADGRVRVIPRPDPPRIARARGGRKPPHPIAPVPPEAREVVVERVGDRDFRVDAGGFWQVHRLAAHSLTRLVTDALRDVGVDPDASHLDLYGGVGLFAAAIGDVGGAATRVTSVESDPRATEHAGQNLAEWLGARAETERVDRFVARLASTASTAERARLARGVVVLDPPRAGAGREVVEGVAALGPSAIVYVACDPVALARDLATFRAAGYETPRVDAVDLFAHSHHLEAIAVLTRG
ncbi:class I SAM-dependent RNA methyltransferase [Microbacterium rhizomatis]|uniref:Class I SAM-dependent RNA methyltransferase n=1 Tax=Microbacterium rhizomatis TaxID=1631477 RepID=A0A5J5J901_9MICO|nr:TRAM domain-containing protein [Microbacterium rhizomatis]KAA9111258.1 class I SAM-dependent RNA methyltransferase [Microbacterium rhizomatis]